MRKPRRAVVVNGTGSDDRLALPVELYTRGEDDELVPVDLGGGGDAGVAWADVTGKPATFPPVVGTTATTAKAGNYQPTAANISDASTVGRSVLTATDAAAARTAISAGTSSLVLGTSASTAAAGNHTHPGLLTGSASAVADAADEASAVVQLNALLGVLRSRGILSA